MRSVWRVYEECMDDVWRMYEECMRHVWMMYTLNPKNGVNNARILIKQPIIHRFVRFIDPLLVFQRV